MADGTVIELMENAGLEDELLNLLIKLRREQIGQYGNKLSFN